MGIGLLSGFSFFFIIPILVAQWIGMIGIGKWRRSGAWWVMITGTGMTTLGLILMLGFTALAMGWIPGTAAITDGMFIFFVSGSFSALGSLLFAIGFAIHGLGIARVRDRVNELEALAAVQSGEIEHLRTTQ